jgi:hypothetical protein
MMDRKRTAKYNLLGHRNDDYVSGELEERISLVWPPAREIESLSSRHDAERRLQRDVATLVRRKR